MEYTKEQLDQLKQKQIKIKQKTRLGLYFYYSISLIFLIFIAIYLSREKKAQIENVKKQIFFFDGKYGLGSEKIDYDNRYFFIDTNGNKIVRLGYWKSVEIFNTKTGTVIEIENRTNLDVDNEINKLYLYI